MSTKRLNGSRAMTFRPPRRVAMPIYGTATQLTDWGRPPHHRQNTVPEFDPIARGNGLLFSLHV